MRAVKLLVVATLVLGLAGSAAAEKKRVGVPKFAGPQEALVRKRVMQALKSEGYELVKSREIESALQSTGADLDSNDGFRALAKELALAAIVTGEISAKRARLSVRNGADGSVIGEGSFSGANPRKVAAEVGKGFSRRLGSAVERGRTPSGSKRPSAAPVAEAPEDKEDAPDPAGSDDEAEEKKTTVASRDSDESESRRERERERASSDDDSTTVVKKKKKRKPVEEEEAAEEEEEEATGSTRRHLWMEAAVGGRGFTRDLVYNQDVQAILRGYKLSTGPAAVANLVFYPLALTGGGPAAGLGIQLDLEQAFGISSKVGSLPCAPMGASFNTIIHDFSGGVRYRVPAGMFEVAPSVSFGEHAFAFRTTGGVDRGCLDLPDTIYRYLRPGVNIRVNLPAKLALMAGAGFRYVLNKGGQIHDQFFPNLTVHGLDASAGAAYRVTPTIEARVGFELRRYVYDMHSTAMDVANMFPIAGGAIDQYMAFTAGVAFMLGGDPGGGDDDE